MSDQENKSSQPSSISCEGTKDREIASEAQTEYENGNYEVVLQMLDTLGTDKAVKHNKLITQFGIDDNIDTLLSELITSEDLDVDQQIVIDYNRALVLAKYMQRYDEAIDLLEQRVPQSFGTLDDKSPIVKLCLLLSILYIEQRKDPKKALSLLQFITENSEQNSFPPRIQQLKAKCYLQLGLTKLAKRELKSISGEPLIRSYLEFQRANYKKAMKIFSNCTDLSPSMTANNEALIQYGLGKKNTAAFLMTKSINTLTSEMLYNFGCFHLFTGNSKSALEIFMKIVPMFSKNPRIWLRIAECCFEQHKQLNRKNDHFMKQKQAIVAGHIGEGNHRKLILNEFTNTKIDEENMCFARSCLNNALSLINSPDQCFLPSNTPNETEIVKLKISILLASTFVNLILADYTLALKHVHDALKLSPSGYQKILAHLYAAEALVWLDKISEAIGHLNPEMISKEQSSTESVNNPKWYPNSAKAIILYNLAVTYTMKGENEKATETLKQIGASSDSLTARQIFMLAIYLQLQQGNVDVAKALIKQSLPQFR